MIPDEIKSLLNEGKFSEARKLLVNKEVEEPGNTEVLNLLAFVYLQTGDFSKAVEKLKKVSEIETNSATPLINLGIAFFRKGDIDIALNYFRQAVERDPKNYLAHYNYALALAESGKVFEAISEYEISIKINPDYYSAYYNLSMLYLLTGNYEKGFELFEYRFKSDELKRKELPGKRWNGEVAKDKTLYVYADQGFGDVIQFIRFLKIAKERVGEIILEVQIELLGLLKNVDFIDRVVPTRPDFSPMSKYDLQIPLMSLPYALKINKENIPIDIPYIFADKEKSERWRALLNTDKKKIGIAWRGNPTFAKNHIRSTNVKFFKEIFEIKNTVFFSLQKDIFDREKEFLLENEVVNLSEYLKDFSDTAAIIDNLDLIITTDTVIPHLSGAMGKPVLLLLSKNHDWRWGMDESKSTWYPSITIFRQPQIDNWKEVFILAKNHLTENFQ